MYSRVSLVLKYLQFQLSASNSRGHGTHSPFVYRFIREVLNDSSEYATYALVEKQKEQLLKDQQIIPVLDFGAGSVSGNHKERSVSSIARYASKSKKCGRLLYRIARYYQPQTILELGTSLGLSTAYLSAANSDARLISLEGAPAIAAKARDNLAALHCSNATVITGPFEETLQPAAIDLQKIDLCFVDGNHRSAPTIEYFNQLQSYVHPNSMLIFDDIHWSAEMEAAWDHIQQDQRVRCTIDLFFFGIVLFSPAFHEPQHFRIRW